jgi:hypothetical protein
VNLQRTIVPLTYTRVDSVFLAYVTRRLDTFIVSTLGGVAVLVRVVVFVADLSVWKHNIFCIELTALLSSVPYLIEGKVSGDCDSTSWRSCSIIVNLSMGATFGRLQCVGKNSTVFDIRFFFVSCI